MRFTLTPRSPKAVAIRSWVRGRPRGLPEILVAIAWASKDPIQIGRYRSASFSFRITRCWAVGMWIRMLSTATSMRFFILETILALGLRGSPRFERSGSVESRGGEGEARAPGFDRRPQPHLQGVLRPAADEHVGRAGDQCRLRLHVYARDRPGLPPGVRGCRLRPGRAHLPLEGVRGVQGRPAGHAGRPPTANREGPRGAGRVRSPSTASRASRPTM